ncbi:hypothetical protein CH063_07332, partial [Colletotrichum higginsianum]
MTITTSSCLGHFDMKKSRQSKRTSRRTMLHKRRVGDRIYDDMTKRSRRACLRVASSTWWDRSHGLTSKYIRPCCRFSTTDAPVLLFLGSDWYILVASEFNLSKDTSIKWMRVSSSEALSVPSQSPPYVVFCGRTRSPMPPLSTMLTGNIFVQHPGQ